MEWFAYICTSAQQEQLAQREEAEIGNGWSRAGDLGRWYSRAEPNAVTAEVTQEQTHIPVGAAGQRMLQSCFRKQQRCLPGISPPAPVA